MVLLSSLKGLSGGELRLRSLIPRTSDKCYLIFCRLWEYIGILFPRGGGGIDPSSALTTRGRGKGWGNWSGRGSNLLPLAQRSQQVFFHLCCSLC